MSEAGIPRKVFITGANGFIARALARRYRDLGSEVCGIDFDGNDEWNVVGGDLLDPAGWKGTVEGSDLVIHTAALLSNTASMDDAWRVNVLGTKIVLDAAIAAGADRFVHTSSVAAFGFDFTGNVEESEPLKAIDHPYVDTKIASEHTVLAAHARGDIACTIIRPTDVYGPRSWPWVVFSLEMIKSGKMILPAHGKGLFSPVYIDDLVEGMVAAASREAGKGQIFTIGGGETPTCAEYFGYLARMAGVDNIKTVPTVVANTLTEVLGRTARLFGRPSELGRNTMVMFSRQGGYSIDKAKRLLGYEPRFTLDQGMTKVEAWLESEGLL